MTTLFSISEAPTDTIDVRILKDSIHLTAPARDIEYVGALALAWAVKPEKAEAVYEHGHPRPSTCQPGVTVCLAGRREVDGGE